MTIITLTTDFGLKDGNVGVMKGVIWRFAPQARIADISHLIAPQNVPEAALILSRSAPYFPEGSIHVVVVDPGVGTSRRPLAARLGTRYFVGPDNGLLTLWLEQVEKQGERSEFVHLDRPEFWLPEISHVFHGRDIFAPVAAHLAAGVPLESLGTAVHDPLRLDLPQPVKTSHGWRGQVVHIDHFGNIASNIREEHLAGRRVRRVTLSGVTIDGLVSTFGQRPAGTLVALLGSTGSLLVCQVNGSAASQLNVSLGEAVEVVFDLQ